MFKTKNPKIDENGILWEYYYLVNLIISTNIETGGQSAYAEFWQCNYVDGKPVINSSCQGDDVKSIMIEDLNAGAEQMPEVATLRGGIVQILDFLGKQQGIFE